MYNLFICMLIGVKKVNSKHSKPLKVKIVGFSKKSLPIEKRKEEPVLHF